MEDIPNLNEEICLRCGEGLCECMVSGEDKLLEANKDALKTMVRKIVSIGHVENKNGWGELELPKMVVIEKLENFVKELLLIALEEPKCSCGNELNCDYCNPPEPVERF